MCIRDSLTAYLKAKEKYDTQREKLAGRYKTKTAMYEALMFLLIALCAGGLRCFEALGQCGDLRSSYEQRLNVRRP